MQQHRGADADGAALHGCDQRTARFSERLQETADMPLALKRARRNGSELADIVAGGEHVALAADQDHAGRRIGLGGFDGVGELAVHRIGQRVLLVGACQRERENSIVVLDPDMLGHSSAPVIRLKVLLFA